MLSNKQQTLIFKDPTQLSPPVQGFPLLGGGNIILGIAVVPPMTLTYYGNDYIEICLAVYLNQKANTSTTYTNTEVDGLLVTKASTTYVDNALASKQNTLTFVDPMNLGTLVAGYPLLIGLNIIPGLTAQSPLTITIHVNNYLTIRSISKYISDVGYSYRIYNRRLYINIRVCLSSIGCGYR